jgi:hypothetical protein
MWRADARCRIHGAAVRVGAGPADAGIMLQLPRWFDSRNGSDLPSVGAGADAEGAERVRLRAERERAMRHSE